MTPEERTLLLAAVSLGLGRAPLSAILSPEDNALLTRLIGGNDWASTVSGLMPLIKAVANGDD